MSLIGKRLSLATFSLIALIALICPLPTAIALEMPTEESVRAAMVFNFLKFTTLPAEGYTKSTLIRICVAVRDTRQAEALAALSGRKVGGRELIVTDITAQSGDCNVLYVDTRERWNTVAVNHALRQTLTISDYPGFVRDGGMIEMVVRNDGVRFDINLAAGRRAGIHFFPEMLRLARQIHD
jgi:hypothetical protein